VRPCIAACVDEWLVVVARQRGSSGAGRNRVNEAKGYRRVC
jgi:hypothetical protein